MHIQQISGSVVTQQLNTAVETQMLCEIVPSCNVLKFVLVAATPQIHFRLVYDTACQAKTSALLLLPNKVMQISTLKRRLSDAGQGPVI